MRLATYNVENLFERPVAMNQATWAVGKAALAAYSDFNSIIEESIYTAAIKTKVLQNLEDLELLKKNQQGALRLASSSKYAILRENKGHLLKQPQDSSQSVQVVASGRESWDGWVDLIIDPVNEIATKNTSQVIADKNPDVIGIVEAENRLTLQKFDKEIMPGGPVFAHIMLIEGNDPRGINVGVMLKSGYEIISMDSHVDDQDTSGKKIFSRDCPVYEIRLSSGAVLWLLINHLKSKGYGNKTDSDNRRKEQAQRVREIYDALRSQNAKYIAIIGDFNDSPDSGALDPLLRNGSDLKDIFQYGNFVSSGIPGTYGASSASDKFDYILLSPDIWGKITGGGVYRKGVYDKRKTPKWEMYTNMTEDEGHPERAASDHALLWADIDI
jgi:endonuclease/exonuclease/phosphatase family metal-dependent hydrolase